MVQPIRPQDASGIYRRQLSEAEAAGGPDTATAVRRPAAGTPLRRADSVSLSEQARSLRRAMEAVRDETDVRDARVEELRRQVADGSYEVDPSTIAERLLAGGLAT